MTSVLRFRTAIAISAALVAASAAAAAQAPRERVSYHLSGAARVPGATLAAGDYQFAASRQGDGYVVTISSGDVRARALALPVARTEAKGERYRVYERNGAHDAPAIRSWFRPGDLQGFMFAYSEDDARKLAHESGMVALATGLYPNDTAPLQLESFVLVNPDGARVPVTSAALASIEETPRGGVTAVR
jgi:hypothetical protein